MLYNKTLINIFKKQIYKVFRSEKQEFGCGDFYQSFELLNINGLRPTNYRIGKYNLIKYLNKNKTILDIGNNTGFLDLSIAKYVKDITGIEYKKSLNVIANMTKSFLNVENCNFINGDFNKIKLDKKFDIVFSFAIHHWLCHSAEEHSNIIYDLLNKNGIVIIESHNIKNIDINFDLEYINNFVKNKFKILDSGKIKDDMFNTERSFYICEKI